MALVVAFSLAAGNAQGGGWPLAPGTGELIVPVTHMRAGERYDGSGKKQWKPRYTKIEVAPYAEYGLTSRLTLTGEAAWAADKTDFFGMNFRENGMTRIKAGARYALGTWAGTHFSVQPLATLHLAGAANDPAATAKGDIDAEMVLVVARNEKLFGIDAFSVQEIAWRYRDSGRPDEVRADITFGAKPWPGIMLLAKSLNTAALSSTAAGDSYQSGKLALSLVHDVAPGLAIEAGMEHSVFGRDAIAERTLRFAVWRRF
ncbi:hypothetical protein [Parvibaculum sp.]|uniref:hypothetical protein n=1 Tax=Parvibaculum sp. TaxID=2024848 RepID=UPI001DF44923|nr:hypothetical protein [Parvibaculum sp.]MBX3488314.1 hypothetical protein [Parvibaculum sp.]MCW5727708.1 hypothetical protein [Parvibaculum sp.]